MGGGLFMSELLDKIKQVQAKVNNCSTLEAKQLLEQADGDVDLAVALFEEAHPEPVAPVAPTPQPQQSSPSPQPRPEPPHQDLPPRRRRRFWWIPLVAVGSYLAITGLVVLIMYQVTDGFTSFVSTYSYSYKKSSSKITYSKPTQDEVLDAVGTAMKNSGRFNTVTSGGSIFEVNATDYNNANYSFNYSTGYWNITVNNVLVYPKAAGNYVSGQLTASGYVNTYGSISISTGKVAGYSIV